MDYNVIAGYISLALIIGREIFNVINHKKCRSRCMGKETTMSLDVEQTTPPTQNNLPPTTIRV
jgi:hypothetical protein